MHKIKYIYLLTIVLRAISSFGASTAEEEKKQEMISYILRVTSGKPQYDPQRDMYFYSSEPEESDTQRAMLERAPTVVPKKIGEHLVYKFSSPVASPSKEGFHLSGHHLVFKLPSSTSSLSHFQKEVKVLDPVQFSAIGFLRVASKEGVWMSTGLVVRDRYVLTDAHNLYGNRDLAKKVTFYSRESKQEGNGFFSEASKWVVHPEYYNKLLPEWDIGIIRLKECLGAKMETLSLKSLKDETLDSKTLLEVDGWSTEKLEGLADKKPSSHPLQEIEKFLYASTGHLSRIRPSHFYYDILIHLMDILGRLFS